MFDTSILNNLVVLATYDLIEDGKNSYWIIIITSMLVSINLVYCIILIIFVLKTAPYDIKHLIHVATRRFRFLKCMEKCI